MLRWPPPNETVEKGDSPKCGLINTNTATHIIGFDEIWGFATVSMRICSRRANSRAGLMPVLQAKDPCNQPVIPTGGVLAGNQPVAGHRQCDVLPRSPASAFSQQKRRLCDRCLHCGWRYCGTFPETCFAMSPGMVYYLQTGPHGELGVGRASEALSEWYTDPEGVFMRV